jgi:hypothetical protein
MSQTIFRFQTILRLQNKYKRSLAQRRKDAETFLKLLRVFASLRETFSLICILAIH